MKPKSILIPLIIPAVAVGAGFAAASGYYFGAQVLHLPISGRLTFNIVAASIAAFFLVYYILIKRRGGGIRPALEYSQLETRIKGMEETLPYQ